MTSISQIVDTEAIYRVAVQQLKREKPGCYQDPREAIRSYGSIVIRDEPIARPRATQPPPARS